MLEQWQADQLLGMPKVWGTTVTVDLGSGVDCDYPLESADGVELFVLDLWTGARNRQKARFQLRYRRDMVLARLCTRIPHTNPDGNRIEFPHLHRYREGDDDKWAEQTDSFPDATSALQYFCKKVNLPVPDIQGGLA